MSEKHPVADAARPAYSALKSLVMKNAEELRPSRAARIISGRATRRVRVIATAKISPRMNGKLIRGLIRRRLGMSILLRIVWAESIIWMSERLQGVAYRLLLLSERIYSKSYRRLARAHADMKAEERKWVKK